MKKAPVQAGNILDHIIMDLAVHVIGLDPNILVWVSFFKSFIEVLDVSKGLILFQDCLLALFNAKYA